MTHRLPDPLQSWQDSGLATLEAAAVAAYHGLLVIHPELHGQRRPRTTHRGIAARSLLRNIERLTSAIERYRGETDRCGIPTSPSAPWLLPSRLNIPTWWSPREADAVFSFLSSLSEAVWDAHEPALLTFVTECPPPPMETDEPADDMPF